ncbi:hypothetical protein T492DRAFT_866265 [Pavlovales sp. CCMP2436]|nr:hypothetical protein T492DRAFT_866265 [Pavlovales sp. CCMP2436]
MAAVAAVVAGLMAVEGAVRSEAAAAAAPAGAVALTRAVEVAGAAEAATTCGGYDARGGGYDSRGGGGGGLRLYGDVWAQDERAHNLTATTLVSPSALRDYALALRNARELRACGATVLLGVDARHLEDFDVVRRCGPFDCVIFNFPHPGWPSGERSEGSPVIIAGRRSLLRDFFKSAVHVRTKTCPWRGDDWWEVTALAGRCGLELVSEKKFGGKPYTSYGYKHKFGVFKANRRGGVDSTFPLVESYDSYGGF